MKDLAPALAAVLLAGCSALAAPPPDPSAAFDATTFEVPELAVLLFYVDGLRADVFAEEVRAGHLPRVGEHLVSRAVAVRNTVVALPSVTFANAASMLTGAVPSAHGVWANLWFDRDELFTRNYEAAGVRERVNTDLRAPTLFESLGRKRGAAVGMAVRKGAEIVIAVDAGDGGLPVGLAWSVGEQELADRILASQVHGLAQTCERLGRWPDVVAFYLPAVDAAGHAHGAGSEEYRHAVDSLDDSLGALLESLDRRGLLERMVVVLTSDHGHVPTPLSQPLAPLLADTLGLRVLDATEDDGERLFVERFERYGRYDVVVTVSGARQANLHLRVGPDWSVRPTAEQALAFGSSPPRDTSLVGLLLASGTVDVLAVRDGEDAALLLGREGTARVERRSRDGALVWSYRTLEGRDPLGYDGVEGLRELLERGGSDAEWLAATADARRPYVVPQVVRAFDDVRAGDAIAFAAPGWDFHADYRGGHGGLEREEMIVPLYLRVPGIGPGVTLDHARLVDLVPTLAELLGLPRAEGWDGTSLVPRLRGGAPDP